MPVGSRTLTEHYGLGVSSATVRNELVRLEVDGYLMQPHTSAGRIPTDVGYRAFVDYLLDSGLVSEDEEYRRYIHQMREDARELDELVEKTGAALARFTDCMSVVLAPAAPLLRMKQLSLISLSPFHALIVLVTEDGQVLNRHMEFQREVAPEELAEVQGFLNETFAGKDAAALERFFGDEAALASLSALARTVMRELEACVVESGIAHAHRLGLSALLSKPEFAHSRQVLPLLQVLEDDTVLLQLFDDMMASDEDPTVRIGTENKSEKLHGVSVVAGQYGSGRAAGVVAVIGPTRMDYSRVIQAVRMAARSLDEA